jgi:16S rRNA (guanine527-N7)-methyltransferase
VESHALPDWLDVSRETHAKLLDHLALVAKWNPAINLVSSQSLQDGWRRHVLDSAQLCLIAGGNECHWMDVASGGGFPGIVVAIVAAEKYPEMSVTLVDSDRRKCTFLSESVRHLKLRAEVVCGRVESLHRGNASVVSARAFSPLRKLLGEVGPLFSKGCVGLFLKGKTYSEEVNDARQAWRFRCEVIQSKTQSDSVVLKIQEIENASV